MNRAIFTQEDLAAIAAAKARAAGKSQPPERPFNEWLDDPPEAVSPPEAATAEQLTHPIRKATAWALAGQASIAETQRLALVCRRVGSVALSLAGELDRVARELDRDERGGRSV